MNRARIAILPMMILVLAAACQGSAPAAPSSSAAAIGTASAEPISLEGQILLTGETLDVANADGTDRREVHPPGAYCCVNRISPDRTQILVMPGTDETGSVRGGTLSLDGTEFQLLPRPDETLNVVPEAWSPDGERIAFEGWDDSDPSRTGIYTARADGSDLVRVTSYAGLPHDSVMDWSPDGTQLLFYRAVRAEPDFPVDIDGSVWVVNVVGTDAHELDTGDVRPWWQGRWSPDGSRILFVEERLLPTGAIWTVRPDGSELTKVFEDADGRFARGAIWSPDGTRIMFQLDSISDSFVHRPNQIYAVNADGTGLTLVVDGHEYKTVYEWWD
jgi:dipeptidyl aminopeptidase/acylaminoacyl peptidase